MRREVRLVLVAAGAVVVLAAASAILLFSPSVAEDDGTVFKSVEPIDVMQVFISNEYGTIRVAFTGEGYMLDDIPAEVVDVDELIDLLTYSGEVYASRTVASGPADLAPFGLAEPLARVEVGYMDNSSLVLAVGNVEPISGETYFQVEGDPAVYLMPTERCAGFLLPKMAYVDDQVTPRLALSSPLSALLDVTFTGGSLTSPIAIKAVASGDPDVIRAAISFGAPTHLVVGKGVYELDQTYGVAVLGSLLGITSYDVVGYGLTHEEITDFGFDQPTMRVEFDLKNGVDAEVEHYALAVLQKGQATYITRNDNGVIYAINDPAFLDIEYSKLLVRWFLSPLLQDVRAIDVVSGGEDYSFVLSGETNADKQVSCNGRDLDIERFRTLYRLLTSAAHDGRLLDNVEPEGEPLLRLTYHYADEQKQPDVMELYPGDARRLYVRVNGVTELAMEKTYLTRVQEALHILWTDEPIETEW